MTIYNKPGYTMTHLSHMVLMYSQSIYKDGKKQRTNVQLIHIQSHSDCNNTGIQF